VFLGLLPSNECSVAQIVCFRNVFTEPLRSNVHMRQFHFYHVKSILELGWFSRYSGWAVGWTAEELWFSFCQGQEGFLDAVQTGSGTHPISQPVGINGTLSCR
jgi:hypothetical protein